MVSVKCDCGKEFKVVIMYLKRAGQKCSDCLFKQNCIVSIGEVYDKLTVVDFTSVKGRKQVVCQCECGNIVNRRPELLVSVNKTNNCGCKPRGNWQGVGKISKTVLNRIKRNAQVRNIPFEVDLDYIWQLYQKQQGKCALSGLDIGFGKLTTDTNEASLDRIDSSIGYIKGNVQWVHKDVNKMKMELDETRFIELCKLVTNKQYNSSQDMTCH